MLVLLELYLRVLKRLALLFQLRHSGRESRLADGQGFWSGRQSVAKSLRTLVQLMQVFKAFRPSRASIAVLSRGGFSGINLWHVEGKIGLDWHARSVAAVSELGLPQQKTPGRLRRPGVLWAR